MAPAICIPMSEYPTYVPGANKLSLALVALPNIDPPLAIPITDY